MPILDPEPGYDLYSTEYRKDHAHLDSFDWDLAGSWWKQAYLICKERFSSCLILDAGCGDGRSLGRWDRWLTGRSEERAFELHGIDISSQMLKLAQKRAPSAVLEKVDLGDEVGLARWKDRHGSVSLLSAFFVLVHFSSPDIFFRLMASILAPGGQFLMNAIPQRHPPELKAEGRKFTIRAYHHNAETVEKVGIASGLRLVDHRALEERGELVSTVFWWEKSFG